MGDYRTIAAVGQGLVRLLDDARKASGLSKVTFVLGQSKDVPAPSAQANVVVIYLYRIEVSPARRTLPARTLANGRRLRPALAFDLHYVLIPCVESAQAQQRLLGWCIRVLEDNSGMPVGLLNSLSQEADIFHEDETVEFVCESLSLQDLVNIFEPIKANTYLSVGYVARMVGIESRDPLAEAEPVQAREFRFQKMQR